jgi:ATP-dependent protease ClpP protease subunit
MIQIVDPNQGDLMYLRPLASALSLFLLPLPVLAASSIDKEGKDTVITVDANRTMYLGGMVTGAASAITKDIQELVISGSGPVILLLNSGGGEVTPGLAVITAIKGAQASGTPIWCVAGKQAQSMAFNIWTACERRFAFDGSTLMFHPPGYTIETGSRLTLDTVEKIGPALKRVTDLLDKQLFSSFQTVGTGREWYDKHLLAETKWSGTTLHKEPNMVKYFDLVQGVRWERKGTAEQAILESFVEDKSKVLQPKFLDWSVYPKVTP